MKFNLIRDVVYPGSFLPNKDCAVGGFRNTTDRNGKKIRRRNKEKPKESNCGKSSFGFSRGIFSHILCKQIIDEERGV